MSDPILTRFAQLEAEVERLRADLNVRSRTIAALLQRADRAEATLAAIRAFCTQFRGRWSELDVLEPVLALLDAGVKETP